jgi:hypothetical protein
VDGLVGAFIPLASLALSECSGAVGIASVTVPESADSTDGGSSGIGSVESFGVVSVRLGFVVVVGDVDEVVSSFDSPGGASGRS